MARASRPCGGWPDSHGRDARATTPWLFILLMVCGMSSPALAATFTASLDRDTITVGESATLSLKFEGGIPADVPKVPNVAGLSLANNGQSSQFTFVNGQSSSIVAYNYLVRATQPGEYTIPAISASVEGKTLTSQPLKLKVVKVSEATPESEIIGKNAFLKLVAPKNELYLGEVLPLEIRLYARQGRWKQHPQLSQEGFTVGNTVQQPVTKSLINNLYYNLLVYKTFVIPAKTGKLTLGPATMLLAVPHPNARVTPFGEIIDWMDANLATDPLTIDVRPLPTNNVPPDFNGAVGTYSLEAAVATNAVTVGDPITVTVRIKGRGPIDSLTLPSLDQWHDFKIYPPITKVETSDAFGLEGMKTFEQAVIPETIEVKELPPITFSFFDPGQNGYRTVTRPATPIIVRPGNAAPAQPTVVATTSQSQIIWRRLEESLANNPRLRRRRQVAQTVREGLAELRRLAAANQSEAFFATVFRLLQEQLGERLDLPASAITEAVVEDRLRPRGVSAQTLAALQELFQACNQARYAPQQSGQELASLAPKVETALQQLQRLKLDEHVAAGPQPT